MYKAKKTNLLVSVVVLRYKKLEDTLAAVGSVLKQTYKNVEIIVVDDATPDESYKTIAQKFPCVKIVHLEKSMGRSAHNEGLKRAKGDILVPIDADMRLPRDFILKLVDKFSRYPQINFIAPNLIHPTDSAFEWRPVYDPRSVVPGGYDCAGGLPAMRASAFDKVGGFNPDIFLYVDEWEHLIRIWEAGYRVVYFPGLVMHHTYSANPYRSMMMGYHTVINHIKLYAMYLPVYVWLRFLFHHGGQFSDAFATGKVNRLGMIKGVLQGIWVLATALPKRRVVSRRTLDSFMKYYFPVRGKVVVTKWGWT